MRHRGGPPPLPAGRCASGGVSASIRRFSFEGVVFIGRGSDSYWLGLGRGNDSHAATLAVVMFFIVFLEIAPTHRAGIISNQSTEATAVEAVGTTYAPHLCQGTSIDLAMALTVYS